MEAAAGFGLRVSATECGLAEGKVRPPLKRNTLCRSQLRLANRSRDRPRLGVCPSIRADRVMGAVGSDTRRRARSRCHSTSSVRNKVDGPTPPITRREQGGCGRISLSRAVADGGHRRPVLSASSTHKTPVRDRTPILGHTPRRGESSGVHVHSVAYAQLPLSSSSSRIRKHLPKHAMCLQSRAIPLGRKH